jgi:hypothetical protein
MFASLTKKTAVQLASAAPIPISSAREIDGTAVWDRARTDGISSDEARAAIFSEMLEDGRAEPSSLMSSLRKALNLESTAEKDLQTVRNERARVAAIQQDWERKVATLDAMKAKLVVAAQEVDEVRQGAAHSRELVFQKIGKYDFPIRSSAAAVEAAELNAALPLMEEAEKALIEHYWTQVHEARDFGLKHGVPKSSLAFLPSRE